MQDQATHASGHVFCVERRRGPQWYAKYRVGGKQVQKRLGPAWIVGGSPPDGYFTKKTAEAELAAILTDARRGALPGLPAVGATVRDAAEEWLRHGECERGIKASTASEYRNVVDAHIVPRFGDWPVGSVTRREVEVWQAELLTSGRISRRTVNKILTMTHGVFERARRVWDLPSNPVTDVVRKPERYSNDLDFYSAEEVMQLVGAAASEQDAAIFLTATFTGLRRGELVAVRWLDVLFQREAIRVRASFSYGALSTPKSGRARTVPMVPAVAERLAALREREHATGLDDLVFPGERGEFLDGSALRRRYKAALRRAGLRELRFHDLRHLLRQPGDQHAEHPRSPASAGTRKPDNDAALLARQVASRRGAQARAGVRGRVMPDWLPGLVLVALAVSGRMLRRAEDRLATWCRQCGYDSGLPRSLYRHCPACGRKR
jgi:integrase